MRLGITSNNRWSEEEDDIIRKYYPIGGTKEVQKYLPNRTSQTISIRANRIKDVNPNKAKWSEEEDDIIRKYYSTGGKKEAQKYLPNRTLKAIENRASALNIKYCHRRKQE